MQWIDQMNRVRLVRSDEVVLDDVTLAFLPGAKVYWTSRPTTSTPRRSDRWRNAILDFPGCVVVTAHDRWFVDRIATHILAWEGTDTDGSLVLVRGKLRRLRAESR